MNEAALDALLTLLRTCLRVTRAADAKIGGLHGLSAMEVAVLREVSAAPGKHIRPIDLARQLHLSASGITRMLDPLEKRGIVAREVDPNDRRSLRAALTDAGSRLLDDATVSAAEAADGLMRRLSLGQTRQMIRLLEEIG